MIKVARGENQEGTLKPKLSTSITTPNTAIEYIADPSKNDALARTLAAGLWGLSFEESATIIRSLRSSQNSKHANQASGLDKKIPALIHLQRKSLNDGAVSFIIHVAEE